jgi:VWFA-related protein
MKVSKFGLLISILGLVCATATAQQQQQKNQNSIPDAPSAVKPDQPPPKPTLTVPPSPAETQPQPDESAPTAPENAPPPESTAPPSTETTPAEPEHTSSRPPINLGPTRTDNANQTASGQDLYRMPTYVVNQVIVPVRVTDNSGLMVNGLVSKDFRVYENGVPQKMNFFTSDPFALSVAVVIDLGMQDVALQKVQKTFSALQGAFSQYDEVAVYTYSSAVGEQSDFSSAGRRLEAVLDELENVRGRNNGVPVMSGPLGPQGPTINGVPADPSAPIVRNPPNESHVLNDAILKAAFDLSKRDKTRRKIIFVIGEGNEYRSRASYKDVLKVLLTNNIMVYGIGTGSSALPIYGKVSKLHIPLMGYSNILPKYASATGGEVSNEYSKNAIDDAYARVIGDARNQYTLGYLTHGAAGAGYRQIEVRVDKPDCSQYGAPCIRTFAKAGYYPLPPQPRAQQ